MRLVDANQIRSKNPLYGSIPQPMVVYHSTEELSSNEDMSKINIITGFDELLQLLRKNDIKLMYNYVDTVSTISQVPIMNLNIWVKTVDAFVPDTADLSGKVTYVKNDKGQPIPTDGCYIRCYYIIVTPTKLILFCSSGINSVGITKWEVTAAIRSQFYMERNTRFGYNNPEYYKKVVDRLSNMKKPSIDMYKFVFALLTPNSPSFMDLDAAARASYGNKIKAPDRDKLLISPAFRSALMQMLKIFVPELKKQVQKDFPPDKLISMLAEAYKIGLDNKKVDDILKVFKELREIGYEEQQVVSELPRLPDIPLAEESDTGKPKEISVGDNGEDLTDEDFESIKESLDYPDGFITNSEPSETEE